MKRITKLKAVDDLHQVEVTIRVKTLPGNDYHHNFNRINASKEINKLTDKAVEHLLMPDFHFNAIQKI